MDKELHARVKAEIDKGYNNTNIDSLAILYQAVFFKPLDIECGKCVRFAYSQLRIWLTSKEDKKQIIMANNKYKIKDSYLPKGGSMQVKGYAKILTTENFDDTDAEYLKKIGQGALLEEIKESKNDDKKSK